MLKTVVIGAGNRSKTFFPLLKAEPAIAIEAVVEPDVGRLEAAKTQFQIPYAFQSLEDLFNANLTLDCAWILTPPHLHVRPFVQCLEQGLGIFCEKPISMDLKSAEVMLKAARAKGRKTMFGFNRRFFPAARLARALRGNENPHFVHVSKSRPMQYERMLAENAVHAVDMLLHIAGSTPDVVRAIGRYSDASIKAEAFIAADVKFVNDSAGHIQMITHGSGVVERLEVYGEDYTLTSEFPNKITFFGEQSQLESAAKGADVKIEDLGGNRYKVLSEDNTGNREEVRHFVRYMCDETNDAPNVEEAFEAQRLVHTIYAEAGLGASQHQD